MILTKEQSAMLEAQGLPIKFPELGKTLRTERKAKKNHGV